MNTDNPTLDRLVEQITGDPAAGLDGLDVAAIDALARDAGAASGEALAEELELAAAAAMIATLPASAVEPMPQSLRDKVLASMPAPERQSASVTDLSSRRQPEAPAAGARMGWFGGLGWAAAAAMFVALIVQPRTEDLGSPAAPPASVARAELASKPGTITTTWGQSEFDAYSGVSGDVVWNNDEQRGYLRLVNMPANDPAVRQYQLWIVDPDRDAEPVDGGVFDVLSAGAEVLIPIDAKLPVVSPAAFAITAEQPGGVVVSEGPLLLVAAT
jgi:hypothetical protein